MNNDRRLVGYDLNICAKCSINTHHCEITRLFYECRVAGKMLCIPPRDPNVWQHDDVAFRHCNERNRKTACFHPLNNDSYSQSKKMISNTMVMTIVARCWLMCMRVSQERSTLSWKRDAPVPLQRSHYHAHISWNKPLRVPPASIHKPLLTRNIPWWSSCMFATWLSITVVQSNELHSLSKTVTVCITPVLRVMMRECAQWFIPWCHQSSCKVQHVHDPSVNDIWPELRCCDMHHILFGRLSITAICRTRWSHILSHNDSVRNNPRK